MVATNNAGLALIKPNPCFLVHPCPNHPPFTTYASHHPPCLSERVLLSLSHHNPANLFMERVLEYIAGGGPPTRLFLKVNSLHSTKFLPLHGTVLGKGLASKPISDLYQLDLGTTIKINKISHDNSANGWELVVTNSATS